jgi:hypothetical protein
MKRPKGPELKMPDVSVPPFLADLFYDLRDRRLLPLVALVVVAIVAVPFLLGSSEEPVLPPAPSEAGTTTGAAAVGASTITVVQAKPGLREYRKRLADRSPTDPFKQHYTAPNLAGAELPESSSSSGSETSYTTGGSNEATTTTTEGGSSPGTSGGAPSGGSGDGSGEAPRLIEFVFDVQISHMEKTADGGQKMSEPEVRHHVPALAQLPGEKTPVVTVAGLNLHNGQVWFLVSNNVKSLDGDFTCATRTPDGLCELLEIEAGFPLELTYGPDEVLYRIKVTKIDAVPAGKVGDGLRSSRASFGGPGLAALPTP